MSRAHIAHARTFDDGPDTEFVIHERLENVVLENKQFEQQRETTAQRAERIMLRVVAPMAVIVVVCSMLTGCGGGSEPQHPQQALSAPAPAADTPASGTAVLYLGDSTRTPVYAGEPSIPDLVGAELGVQVDNEAVSGTAATQAPLEKICASPAPVVATNYAINDPYFESPEQYRAALTAIVHTAQGCGKRVVLEESNGIVSGRRWSDARSDTLRVQYEAVKRLVASETGATYCALPAHNWNNPDGVHPGIEDKRFVAPILAACIRGVM